MVHPPIPVTRTASIGLQRSASALPKADPSTDEETVARRPTVSLVVPARNEARNLPLVLGLVPSSVSEIILVDGHSVDNTIAVARACRPDITVVRQQGLGKGDAVRAGFAAAGGDHLVMIDADGSMSPAEIPRFLAFLDDGFDLVKGSRFMPGGGSTDITPWRRTGNRALLGLVRQMYRAPMSDLCYGFMAIRRRALSQIDLSVPGFEIETAIVLSALRAGLRITEVPSTEAPRLHGTSNLRPMRDGTRVLRTVLRDHDTGLSGRATQGVRRLVHRAPALRLGPDAP